MTTYQHESVVYELNATMLKNHASHTQRAHKCRSSHKLVRTPAHITRRIIKSKHDKNKGSCSLEPYTNHFQHLNSPIDLREKYHPHRQKYYNCNLKNEKTGHMQMLVPHAKTCMRATGNVSYVKYKTCSTKYYWKNKKTDQKPASKTLSMTT